VKKIKSRIYTGNKSNRRFKAESRIVEIDGLIYEESIASKLIKKKWYEFYKKDTFILVAKYRFIRATRPSLKILLEC